MSKNKEISALVKTVLALEEHFAELKRLSAKIEEMKPKSESDFEQMQHLMRRFAECGQSVSAEVVALSSALNDARLEAEEAARVVGARAELLQGRRDERQAKMKKFKELGERVHAMTTSLHGLKRTEGEEASAEERARMLMHLAEVMGGLQPLIQEAQQLKDDAKSLKMKFLEQGADSLGQSLLAVSQKLAAFQQSQPRH